MVDAPVIYLLGWGSVFESIAADQAAYSPHGLAWSLRRTDTGSLSGAKAGDILEGIPMHARIFVAVDADAMNYGREALLALAQRGGYRIATLIHGSAYIAPDAQLGDNTWIGPAATISSQCRLEASVFVSPRVRLDTGVHIMAHGWIGAGSSIEAATEIGSHCVIGANVQVGTHLRLGHHCVLTKPCLWNESLSDGSFLAPGYDKPARVIGANYSLASF